ncbi:MAG: RDD family protein [Jatrophihabitantaceae bacterium]
MTDGGDLVSGEGVAYELRHAGLGSRVIAVFIDFAAQYLAFVILLVVDIAVAGGADTAAVRAVFIVELVLLLAGYPIVCEWLTRGRTLGKLCMGLRVVRDDGGPIGLRHALVRGLAGLILEKPGLLAPITTVLGCATMAVSSREKRLGDMMAGTFVLNERGGPSYPAFARAFWVPYELQPWAMSLDLSRLDDRLALGIRQFVLRANQMKPAAQDAIGSDLRARVLAVTAPPPPPHVRTAPVLMSVLAERRRRAELAAAGPSWSAAPGAWPAGSGTPGGGARTWSPAPPRPPLAPPRPPLAPPDPSPTAVPSPPESPFTPPS